MDRVQVRKQCDHGPKLQLPVVFESNGRLDGKFVWECDFTQTVERMIYLRKPDYLYVGKVVLCSSCTFSEINIEIKIQRLQPTRRYAGGTAQFRFARITPSQKSVKASFDDNRNCANNSVNIRLEKIRMFSTVNTESCTTVRHSITHSNQMFTVMDYLLQVRAWEADLHGALMDGSLEGRKSISKFSECFRIYSAET